MKIQMGDIAHTSATLMHHIGTQGDLWKELYTIANSKDKGWLELTRDIGELAIAYEKHWFECAEVVQDEFEWLVSHQASAALTNSALFLYLP